MRHSMPPSIAWAFREQQLDRDQAQAAQNLIATNQLEQTQDAYAAALGGREQAAAQLALARNTLHYNTLVADHDGVITSENADTGQVVSAGQAVYGLAWSGDTDVILDAAAERSWRIAVGQAADVTFPALPGRRFEARVREIAPAADPQSRTYRVKLSWLHRLRGAARHDGRCAAVATAAATRRGARRRSSRSRPRRSSISGNASRGLGDTRAATRRLNCGR